MSNFLCEKINVLLRSAKRSACLAVLFSGIALQLAAQPQSLEMTGSSATANTTTPVTTPRTVSLFRNTDNPTGTTFTAASPAVDVTFSLANQQYTSIQGSAATPGLAFGGGTGKGNDNPPAYSDFVTVGTLGNSLASFFSGTAANSGSGISLTSNSNVKLSVYSDALINSSYQPIVPVNSTNVYYGDLVIAFSQPVTNPVIHFAGMGADVENVPVSTSWWYHGMAARFSLPSGSPYTLTRLSGSTYFDVTGNVISNSALHLGNNSQGTSTATGTTTATMPYTAYGASGSVQINGTNISSVTFKVALDGDAGAFSGAMYTVDSINWAYSGPGASGDGLSVGISLPVYTISGTVFNDPNALTDNTVNGTGTNLSNTLYVIIYDNTTGKVAAVVPVATDGTYSATGMLEGHNYSAIVTNNNTYTVGGTTMPSSALPSGWVSTGEHLGATAGSDGTVDGKLGIGTFSANVTNANFGIRFVNPLPVTLVSFNAMAGKDKVLLNWVTSSEVNCASYDVQRSDEGINWKKIGNIIARGGGGSVITTYDYADENPMSGKNFYRLQLNDIDGGFVYSNIVIATRLTGTPGVVLYPNPVTNGLLNFSGDTELGKMIITDVTGRCVLTHTLYGTTGTADVSLLGAGCYVCTVVDKNGQLAARMPFIVHK